MQEGEFEHLHDLKNVQLLKSDQQQILEREYAEQERKFTDLAGRVLDAMLTRIEGYYYVYEISDDYRCAYFLIVFLFDTYVNCSV